MERRQRTSGPSDGMSPNEFLGSVSGTRWKIMKY